MQRAIVGVSIISLGVVLLAGFIYFVFFNKPSAGPIENSSSIVQEAPSSDIKLNLPANKVSELAKDTAGDKNKDKETYSQAEIKEEELKKMAASFTERFGSYSNQSNFSNIVDLRIFMSEKMKIWADSYIIENRRKQITNDIYYGITTKAVSSEAVIFDSEAGQASILVKARRREAISSANNTSQVFYQDILVKLRKVKGIWKVDSAFWHD